MKKALSLCSFLVSLYGSGQIVLTFDGFRDSLKKENNYVVVECPDKSAKDLYSGAIKYINRTYKNPDKVIHGQIENEYLKFESYIDKISEFHYFISNYDVNCKYSVELNFKDNKFKYEIVAIEMENIAMANRTARGKFLLVGDGLHSFSVYKASGKLWYPEVKRDIELYFNSEILNIRNMLVNDVKKDW